MQRARGGPYEYKISSDEERRLEQFLNREGPDGELFVTVPAVIARAFGIHPGTATSWLSGKNKKGAQTLPPGVYRDEDRKPGMPLRGIITRACLNNPPEQREAIDMEEYEADFLSRTREKIAAAR